MNTDILETLYKTFTGKAPEAIEPLPGAGSNRRYFRLKGEQRPARSESICRIRRPERISSGRSGEYAIVRSDQEPPGTRF